MSATASTETHGNLEGTAQSAQLRRGVLMVGVALVVAVVLFRLGVSPGYRALVFAPLFFGVYGVQTGLFRTCAFCAMGGIRQTDTGSEPVADKDELRVHRRVGMRVMAMSAGLAGVATLLLAFAR